MCVISNTSLMILGAHTEPAALGETGEGEAGDIAAVVEQTAREARGVEVVERALGVELHASQLGDAQPRIDPGELVREQKITVLAKDRVDQRQGVGHAI